MKARLLVITVCIVFVSLLSLYAEMPRGVAQQPITMNSLSFVTVNVQSLTTVTRVSVVTLMGVSYLTQTIISRVSYVTVTDVSYLTETVISFTTMTGQYSYVTQTVIQPNQRQNLNLVGVGYDFANLDRIGLQNPVPEYINGLPILMYCIFIFVALRSKLCSWDGNSTKPRH